MYPVASSAMPSHATPGALPWNWTAAAGTSEGLQMQRQNHCEKNWQAHANREPRMLAMLARRSAGRGVQNETGQGRTRTRTRNPNNTAGEARKGLTGFGPNNKAVQNAAHTGMQHSDPSLRERRPGSF